MKVTVQGVRYYEATYDVEPEDGDSMTDAVNQTFWEFAEPVDQFVDYWEPAEVPPKRA